MVDLKEIIKGFCEKCKLELYDNYDEIDPTVPDWAKQPTKPTYTPEEIGVSAIPLTEIADMFKNW